MWLAFKGGGGAGLNPPGAESQKYDARPRNLLGPGNRGLSVVLSGHFCASPHVGHARRKQAGIKLQEYLPEVQIKTNKQINFFSPIVLIYSLAF